MPVRRQPGPLATPTNVPPPRRRHHSPAPPTSAVHLSLAATNTSLPLRQQHTRSPTSSLSRHRCRSYCRSRLTRRHRQNLTINWTQPITPNIFQFEPLSLCLLKLLRHHTYNIQYTIISLSSDFTACYALNLRLTIPIKILEMGREKQFIELIIEAVHMCELEQENRLYHHRLD